MIDHVLGRPSRQFRKIQVLAVLTFWIIYLIKGNSHGPPIPILRRVSRFFNKRLTPFQTVALTLLYLYTARNFAKIFNLESPEPLANLYSRSYFRATWVMTALDAGFWTAMRIKRKWLRDICSVVFSLYYLVAAERADEKVRRVRAAITVDHMRVSWNKSTTPYLRTITSLLHPVPNRFSPRPLRIPRPKESVYKTPVDAWLYFEGTREELLKCTKVILDFPGGGFVAMSPRNHDDRLLDWSRRCAGIPVISVDYKKAPEYPYPYALNECYDVYHSIIYTHGRCVGLSGDTLPKIALSGDSAGGNYAAGVTLMILNSTSTSSTGHLMEAGWKGLPLPEGVLLIYPSLDLNIGSWMTDDQMKLIKQRDMRKTNRNVVRRKSGYYEEASGIHPPTGNDDNDDSSETETGSKKKAAAAAQDGGSIVPTLGSLAAAENATATAAAAASSSTTEATATKPTPVTTRLAMASRLSYFNDRILTPEMMRAMVILYIGPNNRPDFTTDFLLSPIVAPDALLARFPKVCFLTGEQDPLVDDTCIFAGRIRQAKQAVWQHRRELGLEAGRKMKAKSQGVEVSLIPGISHGFLQMAAIYPKARKEISRCARWLNDLLEDHSDSDSDEEEDGVDDGEGGMRRRRRRKHERTATGGSITSNEEDRPLEMSNSSSSFCSVPRRPKSNSSSSAAAARGDGGGAGGGGRGGRRDSHGSLGSEVDLLGRRMQGLTQGLTGDGESDH